MKLPFKLICIDIECTSPDPKLGSIVQLSAIKVDKDFTINKKVFNEYIRPLDSYRNSRAMKVHKITEEQLRTAPNIWSVLEEFEKFCDISKNVILASWGAYFDIPFLEKQYEKIKKPWPFQYRTLDLKSIAIWEMAKRDRPLSRGVNRYLEALDMKFEGIPHDALDDITNTIRILKKFV